MKIFTVTRLLTFAVFLDYIESSAVWLGLEKIWEGLTSPEHILHLRLRYYIDANNRKHLLTKGSTVTLGVRQIEGVHYIIGIVIAERIRPIIDYMDRQILIDMATKDVFVLLSDENVPYGTMPEYTVEATIIGAPTNEKRHPRLPSPHRHFHQD